MMNDKTSGSGSSSGTANSSTGNSAPSGYAAAVAEYTNACRYGGSVGGFNSSSVPGSAVAAAAAAAAAANVTQQGQTAMNMASQKGMSLSVASPTPIF